MKKYTQGKLYQFDGRDFVELEPAVDVKVPVSAEALEAVKSIRKAVQSQMGLRPELSVVVSAMLLSSTSLPNLVEAVQQYGLALYSKVNKEATTSEMG
ncbi:hypothetical protein [Herbaspirillum sp. CAH-3]|uniref:hypothetical protein n=1 Tax=Herbaspirillum sp. CAH-3 TaxID=2605746 RepID=UPI0012ACF7B3|nr:hypothetical protein [Herbaspirillum sp. CAH-3]MRT30027.1 hypothetical protein [Herbaspirillum sp. CAH-3]